MKNSRFCRRHYGAHDHVMYGLWPILTTSSLTLVRVWRCNVWATVRCFKKFACCKN